MTPEWDKRLDAIIGDAQVARSELLRGNTYSALYRLTEISRMADEVRLEVNQRLLILPPEDAGETKG